MVTFLLSDFPSEPYMDSHSVTCVLHALSREEYNLWISSLYSFLWHIFNLLQSKYSPQRLSILSLSFPTWQRLSFIRIQNHRQNCSLRILIFMLLNNRREDKRFWTQRYQALIRVFISALINIDLSQEYNHVLFCTFVFKYFTVIWRR
jgi:hypothetical protein